MKFKKNKGISLPTTLFSLVAIGIAATVLIKYSDTSSSVSSSVSDKANATTINECISNYIAKDYFKNIVGSESKQVTTNDFIPEIEFYNPRFSGSIDLNSPTVWEEPYVGKYTPSSDKYGAIAACVPKGQEISVYLRMARMCKFPGETSGNVSGGLQECQQIAGTGTSTASSSLGYNSYNYTTNFVTNAVIYKLYTQVITNPVDSGGKITVGKKSAVSTGETVFSY